MVTMVMMVAMMVVIMMKVHDGSGDDDGCDDDGNDDVGVGDNVGDGDDNGDDDQKKKERCRFCPMDIAFGRAPNAKSTWVWFVAKNPQNCFAASHTIYLNEILCYPT